MPLSTLNKLSSVFDHFFFQIHCLDHFGRFFIKCSLAFLVFVYLLLRIYYSQLIWSRTSRMCPASLICLNLFRGEGATVQNLILVKKKKNTPLQKQQTEAKKMMLLFHSVSWLSPFVVALLSNLLSIESKQIRKKIETSVASLYILFC